ncbi:zip homologous protein 2-like isoform X2 [Planococcus citri]|uniref:zip homologous protein 2-like isoform X2 n=1 Tax=Planococcus citri TaxID=170843 RepID=UPI0031F93813
MADWIHCNMCFIQPREGDSNFILTSCGHVFCSTCENKDSGVECKICKTSCSVIKLRGDVLPNVKEYFEEPMVIAEKLLKAIKFQKGHRMNLFKAYSRNGEKYQKAKTHIQKLESHIRKMESHIQKLEKKVEYYENYRSPGAASNSDQFTFTPYTNNDAESQSHFFNSSQSKKTTVDTPRFPKPESGSAFKQYRREVEYTPASASPAAQHTPHSAADYSSRQTPRSSQSKYPTRTPPYSMLNNLKITGSRK